MNKITEQVWIGNGSCAGNPNLLNMNGIKYILNCAEDLPEQLSWRDGMTHYHVGLRDSDNDWHLYEAGIQVLNAVTSKPEHRILVHCHEGRSRSVYIVACWMVRKLLQPNVESAIAFIKQCGRNVNVARGHFDSFHP